MTGKLSLILGPMYSGKSTTLLNRYRRYKLGNKKCFLIKYSKDNRYHQNNIVTHDNLEYEAKNCFLLKELDSLVHEYDVICVDEVQFYEDASEYCDKWANEGLIVEACGLNGDFKRKPFNQISLLIPLADKIDHITAIDEINGYDAPFTKRLSDETDQEVIGGKDKYKASSRVLFNQ
jgi:thymidine kinase